MGSFPENYNDPVTDGNPRQSWILDFTLWIPCQWKLDSGLQSLAGSGIREQDFLTHV